MATAYDNPMGPQDESEPAHGVDKDYELAGKTIRHAFADGDDEGLARAICDLIDLHHSQEEPDGDEGPAPGGKPNLAMLLIGKKKKE